MDFNNINDSTIFYLKFLKAIFLTENLTELLKLAENLEIDYKSIDLLKMLRDFVRPQTQKHSLPSNVAENLYTFVNISRFSYTPEDKKERFEISNDIIGMLNGSKYNPELPLYQSLIASYFPNVKEAFNQGLAYRENPEVIKAELAAITEIEYIILYSHSDIVSIDEFIEDACEDLLLSSVYLFAIDHLLRENPNLLNDKKFMHRVRFILTNNELLLKQYNGALDEECFFDLDEDDEQTIKDEKFWKLHNKVKKKVMTRRKDS